ncbi:MAG TPA: UDP-2,3-diacylglucosamine diphosphatase [Thermodesulfobacteriota bacterium]
MKIVFIADGHLKGDDTEGQASLAKFLDSLKADTLVVLGDLFDFWTGSNRVARKKYMTVLDSLLRIQARGTKIIYCEGNHDFSMGAFFTQKLKADVYPEISEVMIDGKRFLLGHGDTISMTTGYRLWRGYLRSPLFTAVSAIATSPVVWAIAGSLSKRSRGKDRYLSEVNQVEARLREFAKGKLAEGFDAVVLGHSHAAGVHVEQKGVYANPGSWAGERSYLVYENGAVTLKKWKNNGNTL